jgi:glycosyltransferase involved in cell wall biosynthesis
VKILLVTDIFRGPTTDSWLLDDLAASLVALGHSVDVLVHSPTAPRPRGLQATVDPGLRVMSVGATEAPGSPLGKLASYLTTAARLHLTGARFVSRTTYDLGIYTSIGLFSFGFPSRMRRSGTVAHLLFVLWDFFPIHQLEIGRIRASVLARPLKWLERASFDRADTVAVMSPANERFLRDYHRRVRATIAHITPWAAPGRELEDSPKRERFTAIFGGQLVRGRGVDTLLRAARILQDGGVEVDILIAGKGPDMDGLREQAADLGLTNTVFLGLIPREEYRELLRSVHLGIAVTVPGVSPPSFPSKIVEYCANGLPVVACVEASSDAGTFIETNGVGLSVPAGDPDGLAMAIQRLAIEHTDRSLSVRGQRARDLFVNQMSSKRVAEKMIALALSAHREGSDDQRR